MRIAIVIETRRLPSGKLEVLLERQTGALVDVKLHRQLFELPDNETTSLLEKHVRMISVTG